MLGERVLIVADMQESAHIWAHALVQNGFQVTMSEIRKRNAQSSDPRKYDLIIVDDSNDPEDALAACRVIRDHTEQPILLFTYEGAERFQMRAYDAGVEECVIKPVGNALFMGKVNAWVRRATTGDGGLRELYVAGMCLDPARRVLTLANSAKIKLSALEVRLLCFLMANTDQILESTTLVSQVWTDYRNVDPSALKDLVYRLRSKMEVTPGNPEYIQTVGGVGYRFHAK